MKTLCRQVRTAFATAFIAVMCLATSDSRADLADDLRLSHLEQDVRDLQNQAQQQARRIDALESSIPQARPGVTTPPTAPRTANAKSPEAPAAWLKSENWDQLSPGMPDAKVVNLLGPPTTLRASEKGGTQTLFYSLELEAGGFLSGRVVVADHRVVEIHKPELR